MAVIPLRARCTNCGADELLSRVAQGDGICPSCRLGFCDENTSQFLRDVLRADVAYRLLIRSLQDLSVPSVRLRVLPEPLLEGLWTAVPWREPADPIGWGPDSSTVQR